MIKFFRIIRRQLLGEGKTGRYFKYALGEIMLVMIGILLALQVNNWNENRKAKKEFEFGLKQVYTQLQVNYFDLESSRERIEFQLTYIDSLLNYYDLLNPETIPGIIQLQDYMVLTSDNDHRKLYEPYVKLNMNDDIQNELAKSLDGDGKYISTNYIFSNMAFNFDQTDFSINLYEHLRAYNIPLRFMSTTPVFKEYIYQPTLNFYSEDQLNAGLKLLKDPKFLADIKTLQFIKQEFIREWSDLGNIYTSTLNYLNIHYPNSVDHLSYMEIIGTGTENKNWAIGIPMQQISDGVFELKTMLNKGHIKFRTDKNYTYDWGGGQMNMTKLAFKGTDIPVNEGYFRITINIYDLSYSIKAEPQND